MKKYIVYPRYVTSINDGETHFIGFHQLCALYHVKPDECVDASNPAIYSMHRNEKLIALRVREDGNYPAEKTSEQIAEKSDSTGPAKGQGVRIPPRR